ncbi:MAG TPA: hypothetical protein IAB59_00185 [Candidatus Onthousia faecipullorum]|uniref:Uncharacterized protein n=1 Tax=Candidatus Onthousia faecipullorum TaxID=2840887 RepID=A0A9D1G9J5_9FIRM|nr:hypothetical protein [Candidatus Onthousia faecipullorum]
MSKEDYSKYYIQGSDHYLIPKDIFNELFNEMENWKKEAHQYKKVIDKLSKTIYEIDELRKTTGGYPSDYIDYSLEILREVE